MCDTCFDKGKTESCLVKALAMHASESVLVIGELLCTGVKANAERHSAKTNAPTGRIHGTFFLEIHISVCRGRLEGILQLALNDTLAFAPIGDNLTANPQLATCTRVEPDSTVTCNTALNHTFFPSNTDGLSVVNSSDFLCRTAHVALSCVEDHSARRV